MAINTQKVLVGGLAAGVVMNIIDFIINGVLFGERMKAEAEAFKPGLSDAMMSGSAIAVYIVSDFIVAMLLVFTYAAIRPRFGPGPRTAVIAALIFWAVGAVISYGYLQMGLMSPGSWALIAVCWLINLVVAAMIGAKLYTEDVADATA